MRYIILLLLLILGLIEGRKVNIVMKQNYCPWPQAYQWKCYAFDSHLGWDQYYAKEHSSNLTVGPDIYPPDKLKTVYIVWSCTTIENQWMKIKATMLNDTTVYVGFYWWSPAWSMCIGYDIDLVLQRALLQQGTDNDNTDSENAEMVEVGSKKRKNLFRLRVATI